MSRIVRDLMDDFGLPLAAAAVLVVFIFGAAVSLTSAIETRACPGRWSGSGRATEWTFWGGCRVEIAPGMWLPEKSVRSVDLLP